MNTRVSTHYHYATHSDTSERNLLLILGIVVMLVITLGMVSYSKKVDSMAGFEKKQISANTHPVGSREWEQSLPVMEN